MKCPCDYVFATRLGAGLFGIARQHYPTGCAVNRVAVSRTSYGGIAGLDLYPYQLIKYW